MLDRPHQLPCVAGRSLNRCWLLTARCMVQWLVLGAIVSGWWGIFASPAFADDQEKAWETANAAGMQAYQQGRYADAKQWFLQALTEANRNKEPSPSQAMTLNNLAAVHEALGEEEDAELRYQQSLSVVEAIQGPDHPDLVPGLNNLASLYAKRGQFQRAEPLWRRSYTILESVLGPDHPHLIQSLLLLAQVAQARGHFEKAEKLYAKALNIAETKLKPDHHQTATILLHYAAFLRQANREDDALKLEERAKTMEKNLQPSQ